MVAGGVSEPADAFSAFCCLISAQDEEVSAVKTSFSPLTAVGSEPRVLRALSSLSLIALCGSGCIEHTH